MSGLKNELSRIFGTLKELETRARGLKNQNLADIAASAHGRVKQLIDHPDTELVADQDKASVDEDKASADPNAPAQTAPFPQAQRPPRPLGADEYQNS
jgi:hypothetical protein